MMNRLNDLAINALENIAQEHGFKLEQLNAKADFDGLTLTIKFTDPIKQKVVEDIYGVKMGKLFTYRGEQFEVVEYRPTRPKWPVIAKRLYDGKRFKFQKSILGV